MNKRLLILWLFYLQLHNSPFAQGLFKKFPQGRSPQEIGMKLAQTFINAPHGVYNAPGTKPHIPYFEVCNWYGALTFAALTNNKALRKKLVERYLPLMDKDSALLPVPDHVDYTVFGALPLELFLQTKDSTYFVTGRYYADKQWQAPEGPRVIPASFDYYKDGFTWQTRLWIDDMYMITLLQAQAYRATGDIKYIERAAKEMVLYLDKLQQPNGLFYHAADVPFYWGRGNGWMAAGMTELLRVLPEKNINYKRILSGYQLMMSTLLQCQAADGMWRQLVNDTASWKETSCTGMFSFAMITGVKNGWLSVKDYGNAALKGWLALTTYINEEGLITDVCEGTGAKNDRQYYLDRKKITGDFHGQAPVLWCASALLRTKEKK
ncbi:glycoside hydrolase family 88/105 protein [Ferruginibacter sp.]